MEDFELTKKPDLGIFDKQFPVRLGSDPIHDPTKMTIIQGTDGVLDDLFSYQVYNKLKNHWRLATEPPDKQAGMIWSDLDDNKLYHYGAAWEEILQLTRSADVSPYFANLLLAEYIYHTGDLDTYIRFQGDTFALYAGGVAFLNAVEAATDYLQLLDGLNFIGDNANTKMTIGLTINQDANADEILALKASNVDHGITDEVETDTFGHLKKWVAADGGILMEGYTESAFSVKLQGVHSTENTTKTTAGRASIELVAYKKVGTAKGNVGADANILAVRCGKGGGEESVFIVDEDGDTWQPGDVTANCFNGKVAVTSLILGAPIELTLAGDAITVTQSYHTVDGQGDANDDLADIAGGVAGMLLYLQAENDARTITVVSTGNIDLAVAGNFILNTTRDRLVLLYSAIDSEWHEISRSSN